VTAVSVSVSHGTLSGWDSRPRPRAWRLHLCPGRTPPLLFLKRLQKTFWPAKRPARPRKRTAQNRFAAANAEGAWPARRARTVRRQHVAAGLARRALALARPIAGVVQSVAQSVAVTTGAERRCGRVITPAHLRVRRVRGAQRSDSTSAWRGAAGIDSRRYVCHRVDWTGL
jgi:hypothetical protein